MIMNTVENPLPWLAGSLAFCRGSYINDPQSGVEAQWVAMAWFAPWEHERQQRILRVDFWGNDAERKALRPDIVGALSSFIFYRGQANKLTNVGQERAGILKLALRWFQADNGKPAETLDELVPKYLPSLPIDPFDAEGKPLRYRLSQGEEIEWPPNLPLPNGEKPPARWVMVALPDGRGAPKPVTPTWKVPVGQGILWSVGPDKIDDGGHTQSGWYDGLPMDRNEMIYPNQDIIYLVPSLAKGK
jgi:hypothetical protein